MQELFEKASLLIVADRQNIKRINHYPSRSGRKQGMAKNRNKKTIGRVPLSGLKQNVDYDHSFILLN
jgi:hypothetical protein